MTVPQINEFDITFLLPIKNLKFLQHTDGILFDHNVFKKELRQPAMRSYHPSQSLLNTCTMALRLEQTVTITYITMSEEEL